jgi:Ca-activated chloride channel family protein
MALLWPGFLYLLGLIPLIVAAYVWALGRNRRYAVRYSSLALIREALPRSSRWRRHMPFALFLVALASLVTALARPVAIVTVPTGRATIVLALDVSLSMCSTDVPPNRLKAAKAAALSFVDRQPASTQIGIVAFAGYAELILPPTADQRALEDAIDGLITGRWTAIGSAIIESLDAIAQIEPDVAPIVSGAERGAQPTPVPRGAYAPSIVVLLTDGASNRGRLPLDAAQEAADRGVRVYTIGFGTEEGGRLDCGESYQEGFPFGGGMGFGWGGGGRFRRGIDEETLKEVSDMTGGTYYSAESAGELQEVFQSLPTHLIVRHETTEISFAFAALGALVAALAVALSLIWHPLP